MAQIKAIKYSDDELIDIMEAVMGAVDYWGEADDLVKTTDGKVKVLKIIEREDYSEMIVRTHHLQEAIDLIVSGKVQINEEIRMWIASGDLGMIDPLAADCIAQVACFGKLVYG